MSRETMQAVKACLATGGRPLVWGPPGVGKTAAVSRMARDMGLKAYVLIGSIREPTDILGLPWAEHESVVLKAPEWAVALARAEQGGLLIIDELTTCAPAVQAALLRVIHEGVVGEVELGPEVGIVAMANPPDQAAGGYELTLPMANRFIHLEYKLQVEEWVEEFPSYWGAPPKLPVRFGIRLEERDWLRARSQVAAFISRRRELLLQLPQADALDVRAWPSPRTWDLASRQWGLALAGAISQETALENIAGAVGEGPALEFLNWVREADLPDPEALLGKALAGAFSPQDLPARDDRLFATLTAVAAAVRGQISQERWGAAWRIFGAAARAGKADVGAVAAKTLATAAMEASMSLPIPPEIEDFFPVLKRAGIM